MGSKMTRQLANNHPTLVVDEMDWHQKIALADAGNPVEKCSTMRLLHWLLVHLHAMMVCDLSSTDQMGRTHLDQSVEILEKVPDWYCKANLEVYIRGLGKVEVKEHERKESY